MHQKLRLANLLFWIALWAGVVYWTESYGQWLLMALETVVPIMMGVMFHVALRPHEPS